MNDRRPFVCDFSQQRQKNTLTRLPKEVTVRNGVLHVNSEQFVIGDRIRVRNQNAEFLSAVILRILPIEVNICIPSTIEKYRKSHFRAVFVSLPYACECVGIPNSVKNALLQSSFCMLHAREVLCAMCLVNMCCVEGYFVVLCVSWINCVLY